MFRHATTPKMHILATHVSGGVEAVNDDITELTAGGDVFGDLSDSGFGGFAEYVCPARHFADHLAAPYPFSQLPETPFLSGCITGATGCG